MSVVTTLIPVQAITAQGLSPVGVTLTELSDGNIETGMITNTGDSGILQMHMDDVLAQAKPGHTIAINIKSRTINNPGKGIIDVRYSIDGGSNFIQISDYIFLEDDERSIEFGTVNPEADAGNNENQLSSDHINEIIISVVLTNGIIHDLNITIDDNILPSRIRVLEGRVHFRDGRVRI